LKLLPETLFAQTGNLKSSRRSGRPFRFAFLLFLAFVFLFTGCEKKKKEKPLSPSQARAIPRNESKPPKSASPASGATAPVSGARLAIIIDDLGYDRASADAVFALPFPLTVSVLPGLPHSADVDAEAKRRGYQVMLHLPMASTGKEKPEAVELHPGMSAEEVSQTLAQMLATVPDAIGANNHQGSEATADLTLMTTLMPVLREYKLFFVDSRTTAATVAYDTAHQMGIPSAYRNVPFLDDSTDAASIRKQLALAVRDAQKQGAAIAIGHPHPTTLQVLQEMLPHIGAQGVTLVFVSQLVQ